MPRQAVILVGGRGTRLGALAGDQPKPLAPIAGDVRFLDYLIEMYARHGVKDILLLAGHLGAAVAARYDGRRVRGAQMRVVIEPEPAGTGGALRHAAAMLGDVFFMSNGDSLLDFNLLALTQALGAEDQGALALRRVEDAARYGRVEVAGGRVRGFYEKDSRHVGPALMSSGVYLLRRSVLDRIERLPCSIESEIFPRLARADALAAHVAEGYFIDIGLPETLSQARAELPARMRRAAIFFDRDGTLVRDDGYTHRTEDLAWLPGAIDAVRACNDSGALAIVVTNQSGIARGYYEEAQAHAFHAHMSAQLSRHGAHVDAFYFCPFHGEAEIARYKFADHPDRKPRPGMLLRAELEWQIDHARTSMIGDSEIDLGAAAAAGIAGYGVKPGELRAAVDAALATAARPPSPDRSKAYLTARAAQARAWLFESALPLWWESGFDRGARCFHERMNLDGSPLVAPRRIRVQARQTIVYALAGRLGWPGPWREAAGAGAHVLLSRGLNPAGGTRHLLDPAGAPCDDRRDLYDLAFVLFALATSGQMLQRRDLTDASENLSAWLHREWGHPRGGFDEGEITPTPPRRQNPHMHVFEALLALYEATGNESHLRRAGAIGGLFRDRLFNAEFGTLTEYFSADWTALAGQEGRIAEPGHEFEWSWLLHRWRRLGGEDARDLAERLRIHGEVYGVDRQSNAVFDEVFVEGVAKTRSSRLWPHTERLKANLARYEAARDPHAAEAATQAFDKLMEYCDTPVPGLWRDRLAPDGRFIEEAAPASSFYHIILAMAELIRIAEDL